MSEPPPHRVFRRQALFWCVNGMGLLALYALAYPIAAILFYETFEDWLPDSVENVLDLSVAPLDWLHDNVPLYASYLEWLFDLMP